MKAMIVAGAAALAFAAPAQAVQVLNLNMQFQSGASFAGTVELSDDYSVVLDVDGVLNGYDFATGDTYDPTASTAINWVWYNGTDYSDGAQQYSTFLMNGPGDGYVSTGGYSHWIQFAYDFSNAPTLTFTTGSSIGGTDNFVNYVDPMVSGTIGLAVVPEPATWALLILGFGVVGASLRASRPQRSLALTYS